MSCETQEKHEMELATDKESLSVQCRCKRRGLL